MKNCIKNITIPVGKKYVISNHMNEAYHAGEKVSFTKWKTLARDWDPHKGKKKDCQCCNHCDY